MILTFKSNPPRKGGFTLVEILVCVVIIAALAAVAITISKSSREKAQLVGANTKLRALGVALVSYTTDSNGLLPYEDSPGTDDWSTAADPENSEVWYNVLPKLMGAKAVGELGNSPEQFYDEGYPTTIPGAPYPKGDGKIRKACFCRCNEQPPSAQRR